jgi:nucleoside-diphosphate-sugar epimerase
MESLNKQYPGTISGEEQLEELLSRPSAEVISMFRQIDGDIIFLGISGKIGPSLAAMAKRACDGAGIKKRLIGVSRFRSDTERQKLEKIGIITVSGDLLDLQFIRRLPKIRNVFFLAGMKFGSEENPSLTWAMNAYMPGLVAEHYKNSRIVAYSTGCVYPLVTIESGGSTEADPPGPVGEYAQSCLGRERMFEHVSLQSKTPVSLIRLNYSVEMRYGALVDIALKVMNRIPVDLSMGYFNVIWQGDANDMVLRSLQHASSPARILNITGPEIISVREVAAEFGKLFGKNPEFTGKEAKTALLNNSSVAFQLFGKPKITSGQLILWTADWLKKENKILGKPTHFEVRDGKY